MPIPHTTSLTRTFIRDDVYISLRDWIISGELEPGEKLRDKELATQLGVSRTPIREALRKLEDEGLVETAANRWTRVALITLRDAENIYPIIESLEALALTLAFPQLTAADLTAMATANKDLKTALTHNNSHAAMVADAAFHQTFIDRSQNLELSALLHQLKTKYQRIELAYFSEADLLLASCEEHQQLIVALKANDLIAAHQALSNNWYSSIERLRQLGEQL